MTIDQISALLAAIGQLLIGLAAISAPVIVTIRSIQAIRRKATPPVAKTAPTPWRILMVCMMEGGFFVIIGLFQAALVSLMVWKLEEWTLEALFFTLLFALNAHVAFALGLLLLAISTSSGEFRRKVLAPKTKADSSG